MQIFDNVSFDIGLILRKVLAFFGAQQKASRIENLDCSRHLIYTLRDKCCINELTVFLLKTWTFDNRSESQDNLIA